MPGRLPTIADFAFSSLTLTITPPPDSQPPTNILVLFHGIGDTHTSFEKLGKQLNLPETACIAVRAPKPLPFDITGFHWGDDIVFEESSGKMDTDAGFLNATRLIDDQVIHRTLLEKCGYHPRNIMLLGYGQGALIALSVASCAQFSLPESMAENELGGVVSIGGTLPEDSPRALNPKCRTPILVCAGSVDSVLTPTAEKKLREVFASVEVARYRRPGDGMPSNRDQMMPIMQFFARRLKSVRGVPEGSVELT